MGCDVKVGNKVPLSAQVECPDGTSIFIRAFIYDGSNNLLTTRDMIDRGEGRFENFSYTMPNLDIITVQYLSYDDSSYTNRLEEPCPGTDIFKRLEETGGGGDNPVAGIQAVGKVISGTLRGKVFGSKVVKGRISNTTIKGRVQVQTTPMKGKILNPIVKGKIICKK